MSSTYTERINFIQKILGKGNISRDGNDITLNCPFCQEQGKKKLAVNLENWKFHCWVCSSKGNSLIPIIRKFGSRESLDFYRANYLNDKILSADMIEMEHKVSVPDGYVPIPLLESARDPDVKSVLRYLANRSITEEIIWKYRVGVSPDFSHRGRAIFVSLDTEGEVNYFVSRTSDKKSKYRYINATADKTSIIFNDIDIDWDKKIYLVEGVFDLIALGENGTCLLGSALPETSLLFKKIVANQSDVVLCLDSDMTRKIGRIADLLVEYGCDVSIMDTSSAKDIAEMSQDQRDHAKSNLQMWNMTTSFKYKIANIKSGSMI